MVNGRAIAATVISAMVETDSEKAVAAAGCKRGGSVGVAVVDVVAAGVAGRRAVLRPARRERVLLSLSEDPNKLTQCATAH